MHSWTETCKQLRSQSHGRKRERGKKKDNREAISQTIYTFPSKTSGSGVPWGTGLIRACKSLTNCKNQSYNQIMSA